MWSMSMRVGCGRSEEPRLCGLISGLCVREDEGGRGSISLLKGSLRRLPACPPGPRSSLQPSALSCPRLAPSMAPTLPVYPCVQRTRAWAAPVSPNQSVSDRVCGANNTETSTSTCFPTREL